MQYAYNKVITKKPNSLLVSGLIIALIISVAFSAVALVGAKKPSNDIKTIPRGEIEDSEGNIVTPGYDESGYNYQARIFNGKYCDSYRDADWCQPYADVNLKMKWNDAWLSNKSTDGDSTLDRHRGFDSYIGSGAWLTNHQSGEYEEVVGWDVTGEYTFEVLYNGRTYSYDVVLTQNGEAVEGTLTDNYLPASYPEKDLPVEGAVTGEYLELNVTYPGDYWGVRTYAGTIDADGSIIDGTWKDSGSGNGEGEWSISEGSVTAVYETHQWNYFTKIVAAPADGYKDAGNWYTVEGEEIGPVIWGEFATIQEVYNDTGTGEHGVQYLSPTGAGLGNR